MRKPSSPTDRFSFEDAQWFQSLPDKVQKKHFTTEEQRALTSRRESLILDAADEVLLRVGRHRIGSVPTIQTTYSSSSASSVHTLEDEPHVDSAIDMDESFFDSFRWMEDDDELDLTLDDYHSHLANSTEPASRHSNRRPSFRRTVSLTEPSHVESNPPVSVERDPRTTSSTPLPRTSRRNSYQRDSSRSRNDRVITTPVYAPSKAIDQSTKYYQDPEARLKLRVYLASPSKFDEALEFGFPSLESTEHLPHPRRPSLTRTYHTEPAPQTFYDSENPSFLDGSDSDTDDDVESLPEMDAPHTPSDAIFFRNTHRLPISKPSSSDIDRPFSSSKASGRFNVRQSEQQPQHHHHHHNHNQPYALPSCNREMTLRMTLTRPDLRASEDLLYGTTSTTTASDNNDPLALEHLPAAVDASDIWDQGRNENAGAVKKFWRKVSRR